jgi:hypothetical protein
MSRIGRESSRRGEEFAKLQQEKETLIRKREVLALFDEASKVLKEMFAKEVSLLHNSSPDPYATSVPSVIYVKVDTDLEVKVTKKKDSLELFALSGGVYKLFSNLAELEKIRHEADGQPKGP